MGVRLDIARQPLSLTGVLFFLLGVVFCLRWVVSPWGAEESLGADILLGGVVLGWLDLVPLLSGVGYLGVLGVCAFRVTRIATGNMLHVSRTFLPILFFLVVSSGVFITPANLTGMLAAWLFTEGTYLFIASFRRALGFGTLFNAGVLLGAMPLFYPQALVLWLAVPVALVLFKRTWREGVACFAGLLLPLAGYSYLDWATGGAFLSAGRQIVERLGFGMGYTGLEIGLGQIVLLSLLVLIFFLSAGTFAGMSRSMRTKPSRIATYFLFVTAIAAACFALPGRNVMVFPLLAVGVANIMPFFFVRNPGMVSATLYIALLVCTVAVNVLKMVAG